MEKLVALGLMSGSSLDGLDLAAVQFIFSDKETPAWRLLAGRTVPFSPDWRERLRRLPAADGCELAHAHAALGRYFGELTNRFLKEEKITPDLIASHGHTVFHFPEEGFTTQLGDGAAIAAVTGYPVVCDFRTTDVALGGQGAPLAPIADRLLFPDYDAYLNLGGIANLSCRTGRGFVAFDLTGANQVLDALAATLGLAYDEDGRIARGGRPLPALLAQLERLPYFARPYPKSLGNDWVQRELVRPLLDYEAPTADKLHTACRHLAGRTAAGLARVREQEQWRPEPVRLLITGGGAHNGFLVDCIREECEKICSLAIEIPAPEIVAGKEAMLMALMGALRVTGRANCLASVTGARHDHSGGAVYQGWKKQI